MPEKSVPRVPHGAVVRQPAKLVRLVSDLRLAQGELADAQEVARGREAALRTAEAHEVRRLHEIPRTSFK